MQGVSESVCALPIGFTPLVAEIFLEIMFPSLCCASLWVQLVQLAQSSSSSEPSPSFDPTDPGCLTERLDPCAQGGEVSSTAEAFLSQRREAILHF